MTMLETYDELDRPFTAVVTSLTDFSAASPCEGWNAADVLGHVIDTQRDFLTRHGVPTQDKPNVTGDPVAAWEAHRNDVRSALSKESVASQPIDGFFGPTTIGATLLTFYGFDLVVHRWDLARAAGAEERFTPEELDMIEQALDGFGDHLYAEGICKPAVEVGPDADRQERLLARMGRRSSGAV